MRSIHRQLEETLHTTTTTDCKWSPNSVHFPKLPVNRLVGKVCSKERACCTPIIDAKGVLPLVTKSISQNAPPVVGSTTLVLRDRP